MQCAVCGAPAEKGRDHCLVCGMALKPGAEKPWDRGPEAAAYEDLQQALKNGEQLLGATRGRMAGSWGQRAFMGPRSLLSPYVNLGLTGQRLLLQSLNPSSGRSYTGDATSVPLDQVGTLTITDADALVPDRTKRLVVTLHNGGSIRVRVSGRLGEAGQEMVEVWQSLSGAEGAHHARTPMCPHCQAPLDGPYRFCPFCGKEIPA